MSKIHKLSKAAGDVVRGTIVFILEIATVFTDMLATATQHLDDALDDIQARLTESKPDKPE